MGWGTRVAVLDSGVGFHVDLWPTHLQIDFLGEYGGPGDPWGHGTHVAGLIAGDGYSSGGEVRGVAPYADILSLRVLDSDGRGQTSDVLAALDWLLQNAAAYDVNVVNLSLGKAVEEAAADDPLVQAVEAVWDAGIVVVVSAGNHGRDGHFTITSPGNSRKVITVGSITDAGTADVSDDYVSSYSSMGPTAYDHYLKPDLVAPGNRVVEAMSYEAKLKQQLPERIAPKQPDLSRAVGHEHGRSHGLGHGGAHARQGTQASTRTPSRLVSCARRARSPAHRRQPEPESSTSRLHSTPPAG